MLEKIAEAIWADAGFAKLHPEGLAGRPLSVREHYLRTAVAAVRALREPDDTTFEAAKPYGLCMSALDDAWKDMIDSILSTQPQEER